MLNVCADESVVGTPMQNEHVQIAMRLTWVVGHVVTGVMMNTWTKSAQLLDFGHMLVSVHRCSASRTPHSRAETESSLPPSC